MRGTISTSSWWAYRGMELRENRVHVLNPAAAIFMEAMLDPLLGRGRSVALQKEVAMILKPFLREGVMPLMMTGFSKGMNFCTLKDINCFEPFPAMFEAGKDPLARKYE